MFIDENVGEEDMVVYTDCFEHRLDKSAQIAHWLLTANTGVLILCIPKAFYKSIPSDASGVSSNAHL